MTTRLLIADDEPLIRMNLRETLVDQGYLVVGETGDGQSAVNLKNLGNSNPANLAKVTDSELATLVSQVRGAGLLGMSYVYGYDERGSSYFAAISNMFNKVHTTYSGLRTMTTAKDSSFGATTGLRSAVDIWVPQTDGYSQAAAIQLRAEGKEPKIKEIVEATVRLVATGRLMFEVKPVGKGTDIKQ